VNRKIDAGDGAGSGVVVAVAAQGGDSALGQQRQHGRVQPGPRLGGFRSAAYITYRRAD
jgi:hypothetical protein